MLCHSSGGAASPRSVRFYAALAHLSHQGDRSPLLFDLRYERVEVNRLCLGSVDVEGWSGLDTGLFATGKVGLDLDNVFTSVESLNKSCRVEAELAGELWKELFAEVFLLFVEQVMHLPELTVFSGEFGSFGCHLGALVLLKREVTEDKSKFVAEVLFELLDKGQNLFAGGALVVAILDEGVGRAGGASLMVLRGCFHVTVHGRSDACTASCGVGV